MVEDLLVAMSVPLLVLSAATMAVLFFRPPERKYRWLKWALFFWPGLLGLCAAVYGLMLKYSPYYASEIADWVFAACVGAYLAHLALIIAFFLRRSRT